MTATRSQAVGAGRATAWVLLAGALAGLLASFTLAVERFNLAADPGYRPSCSINPVLSCGSVMTRPQAALFGFPNPLLGIAGFAIVAALAAGLLAGARYRRWLWLALQAGATCALALIGWLISQSLYEIWALCPYCMVVWAVVFPIFWYTTGHNLRHRIIPVPARWHAGVDAVGELPWAGPLLWYLAVTALVLVRFWSYWQTLL